MTKRKELYTNFRFFGGWKKSVNCIEIYGNYELQSFDKRY